MEVGIGDNQYPRVEDPGSVNRLSLSCSLRWHPAAPGRRPSPDSTGATFLMLTRSRKVEVPKSISRGRTCRPMLQSTLSTQRSRGTAGPACLSPALCKPRPRATAYHLYRCIRNEQVIPDRKIKLSASENRIIRNWMTRGSGSSAIGRKPYQGRIGGIVLARYHLIPSSGGASFSSYFVSRIPGLDWKFKCKHCSTGSMLLPCCLVLGPGLSWFKLVLSVSDASCCHVSPHPT